MKERGEMILRVTVLFLGIALILSAQANSHNSQAIKALVDRVEVLEEYSSRSLVSIERK